MRNKLLTLHFLCFFSTEVVEREVPSEFKDSVVEQRNLLIG